MYLVWPFLVRALTVRRLAWLFVAIGLAEPVLRYASFAAGVLREGLSMATWLRLDGFAWGGLLAIVIRDVRLTRQRLGAVGIGALGRSAAVAAGCAWTGHFSQANRARERGAAGLCGPVLCGAAGRRVVAGVRGPGAAEARRIARYFGRISYCLYLVHQFAFWSFDRTWRPCVRRWRLAPLAVRAVIVLAVSTVIAELSWRYVEAPSLDGCSRRWRAGRGEDPR